MAYSCTISRSQDSLLAVELHPLRKYLSLARKVSMTYYRLYDVASQTSWMLWCKPFPALLIDPFLWSMEFLKVQCEDFSIGERYNCSILSFYPKNVLFCLLPTMGESLRFSGNGGKLFVSVNDLAAFKRGYRCK